METLWNVRANHGGGYQYRLCPLGSEHTEECFHKAPMPFAGNSKLMMSNGSMLPLESVFVSEGTIPANSTWQMMPIPMGHDYCGSNPGCQTNGHPFPPPCGEENDPCGPSGKENGCAGLAQGLCSGEWMNNITIYDSLKVPEVTPGEYVLGFRWDCESTAQVWQSVSFRCATTVLVANSASLTPAGGCCACVAVCGRDDHEVMIVGRSIYSLDLVFTGIRSGGSGSRDL